MTKDDLVAAVKSIHGHAKAGNLEKAYTGYRELFKNPGFAKLKPEDQRQALKLMVLAKGVPKPPTPIMVDAHRAAVGPLTELVSAHDDPADYLLLGVSHVLLGNEKSAEQIFRSALKLERERNAASELCGQLMTRLSQL